MLVVRPAGPADLDHLLELAILSGPGFTSLPEDPDQLAERLTGEHGLEVELHGGFTRPPKPFDESQVALFNHVREAGELLGQTIAWKASGGVCEGNNLHAAGLPNIDTLGVRGGDIHSDQEFAWPDSFVERAQLSALILCKVASGEIDAAKLKSLRMETP